MAESETVRRYETWYLVKVQAFQEDKIRSVLEQQTAQRGLQSSIRKIWVPKITEQEMVTDRKTNQTKRKMVERIVHPGYLYLEMNVSDVDAWDLVMKTSGVSSFVAPDTGAPEPLPKEEIEELRSFEDRHKQQPKSKVEFEVGMPVKICTGAFENYNGKIEEVFADRAKLRVTVFIFGRSTPIELEFGQVQRLIDKNE